MDSLSKVFADVGLDGKKWHPVFKEQLGIQSIQGLQYTLGREAYKLLVQFVSELSERKALQVLLKVEESTVPFQDEQKQILEKRLGKLKESLETLIRYEKSYRTDQEVQSAEAVFQETLQIPEHLWIAKEVVNSVAISKMEAMLLNIEKSFELNQEINLIEEASDSFGLHAPCSAALRGFSPNSFLQHEAILRLPSDIQIGPPMRSEHFELIRFDSRKDEEQFFKEMGLCGSSMPDPVMDKCGAQDAQKEIYCSTVRYHFVPMASCVFDDHHLQLSEEAMSQLVKIEKVKKKGEYKLFFQTFGSHSLRGPFHFGGVYMWKCYTSGYASFEKENVKKLHDDVIDAQVAMCIEKSSDRICVSDIPYFTARTNCTEKLRKQTFIEVIIAGGPQEVVGFPDWKNCLLGSSSTWKLIDCGVSQVPVWEIILTNHQSHFSNASSLASEMRWQCKKLDFINPKIKTHGEVIKKYVQKSIKPPYQHVLQVLQNKKNDAERQLLDPHTWAYHFLTRPKVQEFFNTIISKCEDAEKRNIKRILQELVEPTDIRIVSGFSMTQSTKNGALRVYDAEEVPPPILKQHFINIKRYFKYFLDMMQFELHPLVTLSKTVHPYYIMVGTRVVEKAVCILQKHLVMTGQQYEECLLLTLLHPLHYNPTTGRFSFPLTVMDAEYLWNYFAVLSDIFFKFLDHPHRDDLMVQSHLFYLTIQVSEMMSVSNKCTASHIDNLKHKLKLHPELSPILDKYNNNDWTSLKSEMEAILNSTNTHSPVQGAVAMVETPLNISGPLLTSPGFGNGSVVKRKIPPQVRPKSKRISLYLKKVSHSKIFETLGLLEYFPQKLSLKDALQIREYELIDPQPVTKSEPQRSGLTAHTLLMVKKIMSFDHRCRMAFPRRNDSDSESDDDDSHDDSIHPLDCLLALLHCSDNFLRQDLLCRLATCQLALPLLLPSPSTQEPTLLLWAMRSIVKEFKLPDDSTFSGRLISYPAPFVSFLRIGHHSMSKSETLNGIINNQESDNKNIAFLGHNYPGGKNHHELADGLVEVSWYLPGDKLFNRAIAFTNLRGDAINACLRKQIDFLSEICSMHVILLSDITLQEDALRSDTIELLKCLSQAPGGVILVQTDSRKGYKEQIAQHLGTEGINYSIVRHDTSSTVFCGRIRKKIKSSIEELSSRLSPESAAHKHNILIDEDDIDCVRGRELADKLYTIIEKHQQSTDGGSPKDLLPLQSEGLWHKWAKLDKEQYRQKSQYKHEHHSKKQHDEEGQQLQGRTLKMSAEEYGALQRKKMKDIRFQQYPLATNKLGTLMATFVNDISTLDVRTLRYYLIWLKFKLDDLSRVTLPPFHARIREKRYELSEYQKQQDASNEGKCQNELKTLDKELINASFGLEHVLREVSQIYEAVAAQEDLANNPQNPVADLPMIVAELLCDGFPIEILDGDASHMPQKWISAVLSSLSTVLEERISCETKEEISCKPKIYVLSVLGVQSTGSQRY